jgi:hypothetical protein
MFRGASPLFKVGLLAAVIVITGARLRAKDIMTCTREITRCLSACRAVCARRIAENEREAKRPGGRGYHFLTTPHARRSPASPDGWLS